MAKAAKLSKRLRRAMRDHALVELWRSVDAKQAVTGYVVGVGRRWVLIRGASEATASGWTALRLGQVRRIDKAKGQRVTRTSLQLHGQWPPAAPTGPVDVEHGTKRLIRSLAGQFPVLAIHYEHLPRTPLYVGRPHRWRKKKVTWHDLNPDGRWTGRAETARLRPITQVSVDDTYLRVLSQVGGPEPAVTD